MRFVLAALTFLALPVFAQAYLGTFTVGSAAISQSIAVGVTGSNGVGTSHVTAATANEGSGSAIAVMTPTGIALTQTSGASSVGDASTTLTGLGVGAAGFGGQSMTLTGGVGNMVISNVPIITPATLPTLPTMPTFPVLVNPLAP